MNPIIMDRSASSRDPKFTYLSSNNCVPGMGLNILVNLSIEVAFSNLSDDLKPGLLHSLLHCGLFALFMAYCKVVFPR